MAAQHQQHQQQHQQQLSHSHHRLYSQLQQRFAQPPAALEAALATSQPPQDQDRGGPSPPSPQLTQDLLLQYAQYLQLHSAVVQQRQQRRARLLQTLPADAGHQAARRGIPPPLAVPLQALRQHQRQRRTATQLHRNLPLPAAGAARLQPLGRPPPAEAATAASAAPPALDCPTPLEQLWRLPPNQWSQLQPALGLRLRDTNEMPPVPPDLHTQPQCQAAVAWLAAQVDRAAAQPPPACLLAADETALTTLAALAAPQRGAEFWLPLHISAPEGTAAAPATPAVYLQSPWLPDPWDVRSAQSWWYERLLHLDLHQAQGQYQPANDSSHACSFQGWLLQSGGSDGVPAASVPLLVRHETWRGPQSLPQTPGATVLLAARADCQAPDALERMTDDEVMGCLARLMLQPAASSLVATAINVRDATATAALPASRTALEKLAPAAWPAALHLLLELSRQLAVLKPGDYVLHHVPQAATIELCQLQAEKKGVAQQEPSLETAPRLEMHMPLVYHADQVPGTEPMASDDDPALLKLPTKPITKRSQLNNCYDYGLSGQCSRGDLCPFVHVKGSLVRLLSSHLADDMKGKGSKKRGAAAAQSHGKRSGAKSAANEAAKKKKNKKKNKSKKSAATPTAAAPSSAAV